MDWTQIIIAIIAALASSGAVGFWFERRLKAAEAKRTEAEAKLREAESEKARAEAEKTRAEAEGIKGNNVSATNDEWRELYEEQKHRGDNLEKRIELIETEFRSTLRAEHKRAVEREIELLNRIEILERDQLALQEARRENLTLTQRNSELTTRVRQLEDQVRLLRAENVEKDAQIHALLATVQELTQRIATLEKVKTGELSGGQS